MEKLQEQILELKKYIPHFQKTVANVSKGSVGWHISHSLMSVILKTQELKSSNPKAYKPSFNFKRMFVFALGFIPRGASEATEDLKNLGNISEQSLVDLVNKANLSLESLGSCVENSYILHPELGILNLNQTLKLLNIHTQHHLKIIRDIVKE